MSATISTSDLAGSAFPDITVPLGPFTVIPAVNLSSDTALVSEFVNLDGTTDYGFAPTFTASKKGRTAVATNPGSFHVTEIVQTPGPCAGIDNISFAGAGTTTTSNPDGTVDVTLTIPAGFGFVASGTSPIAHVFAGVLPQGVLFDYHNPALPELTSSAPQTAPVLNLDGSQTITIKLGNLPSDNGGANGTFSANSMVYVRAHTKFTGTSAPAPNTAYTFSTSDHVDNVNGSSPAITMDNSSSYVSTANPQ